MQVLRLCIPLIAFLLFNYFRDHSLAARQRGADHFSKGEYGLAQREYESALKSLRDEVGIRIMKLRMNDNVPHGGCRPRKSRRRRWRTKARKGGR